MSLFSSLNQSIFLRIYAGLLLVCLLAALFAQLLLTTINAERVQTYRENMATAGFHLISEGLVRQKSDIARKRWLNDVSILFDNDFHLQDFDKNKFKNSELNRLEKQKSVVRFDPKTTDAEIFHKVANSNQIIYVNITKLSEQQMKGLGVLLLDDLSYYPTVEAKQQRLQVLQSYFPFKLSLQNLENLKLDSDQQSRLLRKDIVISFKDSASVENSSFRILAPTEIPGIVVVLGAIPLFNWFPLNLIISITLISMFLISLGVYAMIFPLERKLQLIQTGISKVRGGKLDTKVKVIGEDEIAHLALTFNSMTEHIRRLIESQRELTRAVSHELRTPVARIRFAVDMLADTDEYEDRMSQRDYIEQDIEDLNALIDEILTYAKLEEGSPKMEWEEIKLSDLVAQIVRETNALGKSVVVEAGQIDDKAVAVADRRYLHRVLQNLAGNATRYANKKIIVTAGVNKKEAFISVEDDGQGIPKKDREKVFIPFARLDDSRTRATGGYGLGLSIVSRIAFWFNGKMSVDESPTLGGARFIMTWPIKPLANSLVIKTD
ncbi:integral membrane sensor signal transduction histidine kinase [Moraxella macacae 0408225]|uniref:histidine kinase n=1 Tax=Moraxella macacae 0408225 TaxID=1230338 RepID=L2FA34_9GAMM|nr:ATP-binding protein [Moraxella macacae]ELA09333.1 integral membrane sensor signal transduction histidine kinase [Moraxella macacae 0408225]